MTNAPAESGCPDENALAELVQGLLDEATAAELVLHLDSCSSCRRIVSEVGRSSYLVNRQAGGSAPAPSDTELAFAPPRSTWTERAEPFPAPPVGTLLAGKYRVERELGRGGMGVVMAARHVNLGKLVALKLMRPDLAIDPNATQRFVREARAASRLHSEHIVRVIDLDTLDDGAPYIAMEYLEGQDLGAQLAARGPCPAAEAATYIVQVCEAIAEAHAVGIVHRDLKPANLFVTRRGDGSACVKVLDFGVSKIIAGGPLADDLASTDTKALIGSPHYMAPEQLISAKAVDPRTDVWALGCILFQLVVGAAPFDGTSLALLLASILRDEPKRLDAMRSDIPPGFADVVARCLEKDPTRRFQRVSELAAVLVPYVADAPRARMPELPVAAPPASAPASASRRSSRRRMLALIGALALAAGFAATRAVLGSDAPARSGAIAPSADARTAPGPADAGIAPHPADAPRPRDAGTLEDELIEPRLSK